MFRKYQFILIRPWEKHQLKYSSFRLPDVGLLKCINFKTANCLIASKYCLFLVDVFNLIRITI